MFVIEIVDCYSAVKCKNKDKRAGFHVD
jgi:hypothetical protein